VSVCMYFGLYLRLGITGCFLAVLRVGQITWVRGLRECYAKDCLIILGHWERDADLVLLGRTIRGCYIGGVAALIFFLSSLLGGVGLTTSELGLPIRLFWGVPGLAVLGLGLLALGLILGLLGDLHTI
jgi:hypothetical protein